MKATPVSRRIYGYFPTFLISLQLLWIKVCCDTIAIRSMGGFSRGIPSSIISGGSYINMVVCSHKLRLIGEMVSHVLGKDELPGQYRYKAPC